MNEPDAILPTEPPPSTLPERDLADVKVECLNVFMEIGKIDYRIAMKNREVRALYDQADAANNAALEEIDALLAKKTTLHEKALVLNQEAAKAMASTKEQ